MENKNSRIKNCIETANESLLSELLSSGLDPNHEGGWPLRLAARLGFYNIVNQLIRAGANPHSVGEAGASTLQLAVFSGLHWETDNWTFLLSCCDSSQLADGAAVAIVFRNIPALRRILQTGRCNTNLPTSLTGKTVENLAKGYKLQHLLILTSNINMNQNRSYFSPQADRARNSVLASGYTATGPSSTSRTLSPSVARFFLQTANRVGLSPPHRLTRSTTHSPI